MGAIAEYPASLFPLGGIVWRTSQNTIEVILMQINGPGILQFSPRWTRLTTAAANGLFI